MAEAGEVKPRPNLEPDIDPYRAQRQRRIEQRAKKIRPMMAQETKPQSTEEQKRRYRTRYFGEKRKYQAELRRAVGAEPVWQKALESKLSHIFYATQRLVWEKTLTRNDARDALRSESVPEIYLNAFNMFMEPDRESEELGEKLFERAEELLSQGKGKRPIDPLYKPILLTFTKMTLLYRKSNDPEGKIVEGGRLIYRSNASA